MTSVSLDSIKRAVCAEFGITHAQLMGRSRAEHFALPRALAIHLARELTSRGCRWLGYHFSRDKQTIFSASRTARARLASDPDFAAAAARVRTTLSNLSPAATANAALSFSA